MSTRIVTAAAALALILAGAATTNATASSNRSGNPSTVTPLATPFVTAGRETVRKPFLRGAAVSAGNEIRPELGRWSGPTDPGGFIGFKVTRPKRVYNVKNLNIYGDASCSTGREVGFAIETRSTVGVDTGQKRPYFSFAVSGYVTSPQVEGPAYFRADVLGRFISHVRARGDFEIEIRTTDPKFGLCAAEDVSWHATFD